MNKSLFAALITASTIISGCGTYRPVDVADPSAITLNAALIDVADSLNDLNERTKNRDRYGLIVDEVSVTFNINSKATNTGKLTLNAGSFPVAGGNLGLIGENQLVGEGFRGNQVTIKLKNLATADTSNANPTVLAACQQPNPPDYCRGPMIVVPQRL